MPSDTDLMAKYRLNEKDQADKQAGLDSAANQPLEERLYLYAEGPHHLPFPFSSRMALSSAISFLESLASSRKAASMGFVAPR